MRRARRSSTWKLSGWALVACLALPLAAVAQAGTEAPAKAAPVAASDVAPSALDASVPAELNRAAAFVPEPEIPKSEPPGLGDEELSVGWTLLRTFAVLGMVIALVYLTLNVGLRKLLGIRPTAGASVVTVLERVALDQRRVLFVVEAAGEVLLIGGSDTSLTLLSKLDRAEVDRLRAARASGQPVQLSPFLQKLLGRKDAPPPPAA